jgi:protocatechuate 3,4-dioxygenase beta subunit
MIDVNDQTITQVALDQMAETPSPRLKQIMEAAVRHLHAFAREVDLTPEEWLDGIAFLTRVGQTCTPVRQEFILLSDVLGLSTLINTLHDKRAAEYGTQTSVLGPFYRMNSPEMPAGASISADKEADLALYGRVTDISGKPVPNATVQIWQTDDEGAYDIQIHDPSVMDLRGTFRTDADGRYSIRTLAPLGYMIPMDGPVGDLIRAQNRHGYRPAHIHFMIGADGYRELVTAMYLSDDEHVDSDTVFGVSESLVVTPKTGDNGSPFPDLPSVRYDFSLGRATNDGSGRVGADPSQIMPLN